MSTDKGNSDDTRPLLVWGTFDAGRPRVRILTEGLRQLGVPLHVENVDVWRGVRDRGTMRAGEILGVVGRYLAAIPRLVTAYRSAPPHRAVLVPYPGIFDLFVLAPLARARGVPIIWDLFISPYDTVVNDRRILSRWNPIAIALYLVERGATRIATHLFLDTSAHARRFEGLMRLAQGRVGAVPLGTDPERFPPRDRSPASSPEFRVLFYGQYIPLHGLDTIVRAAHIAERAGARVRWTFVGAGQEQERITRLIEELGVRTIDQRGWVAPAELPALVRAADLGLGIFGTSGKALTVIPNKVYELSAAQVPIVTADTPAMRELAPGHPDIHLVPPGDADALATLVMELALAGVGVREPLPIVGPREVASAFLRAVSWAR